MLSSLSLLPVYDSAQYDIVRDLLVPLLRASRLYVRGVGYFTSAWLRHASEGLVSLVERGGHAQVVVSPHLDPADWEAMKLGERARNDPSLQRKLLEAVNDIAISLDHDTRTALAWMVADGVLEFRIALPRSAPANADYHDKVAVFTDDCGDQVAIHGSFNDTAHATLNGEAFSVFASWVPGQDAYVRAHDARLSELWAGGNRQFRTHPLSEAVRDAFIDLKRGAPRPYALPPSDPGPHRTCSDVGLPPSIDLRPEQVEAVTAWERAGCRGIFQMATGTGKTVAALVALGRRLESRGRIAALILVPYLHLVDQWDRVCREFGYEPILCSGSHQGWPARLLSAIQDLKLGARSRLVAIAVHQTAASERYRSLVAAIPPSDVMVLGDEVHGLGAPHLRRAMCPEAEQRLGLSATPHRWYDDEGTSAVFGFFGATCYDLDLASAISRRMLTPYTYHPLLVHLTPAEVERYASLSAKIAALQPIAKSEPDAREGLAVLLSQRASVIQGATDKLPVLLSKLEELSAGSAAEGGELSHVLVYCAPGQHRSVLKALAERGLRCHEFVHTTSPEQRQEVLGRFGAGDVQVIVAVKCLDEGVDLPATRIAFLMASSTNPREFVQRRGRILRTAPGKESALLFDFVVAPDLRADEPNPDVARSLLRRELPRFVEFSTASRNQYGARAVLRPILDSYEMLQLLDQSPWDVYRRNAVEGHNDAW